MRGIWSMKKILLTGSGGFIGKNLKEHLQKKDYELLAPDHAELDLMDETAVFNYLRSNGTFDTVIHSANINMQASTGYDILNSSLRMFYNLEKNKAFFGRMYYLSSAAEYDRKKLPAMVREDFFGTYIPADSYGFTKYVMHKETEKDNHIYGLSLFGVYGKYEEWQRRFISNNIVRSLKGLPMTLSQDAMFDYLYIDDLCGIIEWFIEHEPKHKHYNVCTGQPVALSDLANRINEVSGLKREIQIAKDGWQSEYSGDNSRLLSEMGGFSFTNKIESIQEMWNYYAECIDELDTRQLL